MNISRSVLSITAILFCIITVEAVDFCNLKVSSSIPKAKCTTLHSFSYTFDLDEIFPIENMNSFLCVGNLHYRLWSNETFEMLWEKKLPVMPWFRAVSKDGKYLLLSGMKLSESLSMYLNVDYEQCNNPNISNTFSLPVQLKEDYRMYSEIFSDLGTINMPNLNYEYISKRDDFYTVLLELETNRVIWQKKMFAPICFSIDSKNVFIGNMMFDTITGKHIKSFPLPGWVEKQVVSPNGQYICFNIWRITPEFNIPNNEYYDSLKQLKVPCAIIYDIEKFQLCSILMPDKSYCFRQMRFSSNGNEIHTLESEYLTQNDLELGEHIIPRNAIFPLDVTEIGKTWRADTGSLKSSFADNGFYIAESILDNSLHIIATNKMTVNGSKKLLIVPFEFNAKQAPRDNLSLIDDNNIKNEMVAWLAAKWGDLTNFCQIVSSKGEILLGYTCYGQIVVYSLNKIDNNKECSHLKDLGFVSQSHTISPDGRFYAYYNPIEQCVFIGEIQRKQSNALRCFFISELISPLTFSDDSKTLSFSGRIGDIEKRTYLASQALVIKDNLDPGIIHMVTLDIKTGQSTIQNPLYEETCVEHLEKNGNMQSIKLSAIKDTFIILGKDRSNNQEKYTFKQDFKNHTLYLINKETGRIVWTLSDWSYQYVISYAVINSDESCFIINRYGIFKIAFDK